MDNISVKDKEELIVGTILEANKQLRHFLNENQNIKKNKLSKLFESKYIDVIEYNMKSLFANVTNTNLFNINESEAFPTAIENTRKNYYSYFNKVYKFLNGYELNLQTSLNESLKTNDINSKTIDINTFKYFLKNIINTLENQNDIDKYSQDIINLKTFAKQPLFVLGYNICDNEILMKELNDKFNSDINNILGILYSKKNKELLFIPVVNSQNVIVYSITNDTLSVKNNFVKSKIDPKNYISQLRFETDDNTLIEIYTNKNLYDFKFTDNLYHDFARNEYNKKCEETRLIK